MKSMILRTALASLAFVSLCGCRHKGFDDPMTTVRVRVDFNWQNAPDADPTGMCVYFYNEERDIYRRFDFKGTKGGIVDLPLGTWHVTSYNNDTEAVLFGNDHDFLTHFATTRAGNILEPVLGNAAPIPPRAEDSEDERIMISPDMLWGNSEASHKVEVDKSTGEALVTMYPEELVCTYSYEIRNVTNLDQVVNMCGALSSMSPGLDFHDASLHNEGVTIPFGCSRGDDTTIVGEFYTFGHHAENAAHHRVTLYVWMEDGKKYAYGTTASPKWDVTEQIHNAPDKRHVHFIIDGLDLPVPLGNGGMDASTDDWGLELRDIEM